MGNRTENSDPIEEAAGDSAQTEEETPTSDPACDFRFMHPCLHTCSVRCHVEFSCCATRTNREVHSETLLHQAKQSW